MNRIHKFKGIILDLDGTVLDSMGAWHNVGSDFLKDHGITPPDDLEEVLKPMSFYESANYFIDNYNMTYSPEEIMAKVYDKVAYKYKNTVKLKAGSAKYLKIQHENGIEMCIATATDKELAQRALEREGIYQYFSFIITCDEVGKGKEDPLIYMKALQRLKMNIEEVCVFEDALHCANTAKKAGFYVVGVYDEYSHKDMKELKNTCDKYIMSYDELI